MFDSMFEASMKEHFRETEYIRKRLIEAEAVIEQLHRGYPIPGKPVYIHPADFSDILNEAVQDVTFQYIIPNGLLDKSDRYTLKGVQYVQTTLMPKITKEFD